MSKSETSGFAYLVLLLAAGTASSALSSASFVFAKKKEISEDASKTSAPDVSSKSAAPKIYKGQTRNLPVSGDMLQRGKLPWVLASGSTENASVDKEGFLRVKNVANGFSSKSGTNMQYRPFGMQPARGVFLSYEVYFEPGWCWGRTNQGGKLPGFEFRALGVKGGTGGNWSQKAGSFRPMWGPGGSLNAYIYYNKQRNDEASRKSFEEQDPDFAKIANASGTAGQRLWAENGGFSKKLEVGKWNRVSLEMYLNDPGKKNGVIALSLGGERKSYTKMFWRSSADQLIRELAFSVWHGGSSSGWGCDKDVYARFRNFGFATLR